MSFILKQFAPDQLELIRSLSTRKGFIELFEKNLTITRTVMRAYRLTEEVHEDLFGKPKYSSYDSFRHSINRKSRKKKK